MRPLRPIVVLALLAAGAAPLFADNEYEERPVTPADRTHWAYRPPQRPALPKVDSAFRNPQSAFENPIDAFILAKLDAAGLAPMPAADPATLLRRLHVDLTGLPPTPEEVDGFQAASIRHPQSAIRNLADKLLASPAYGERWAQHWLDLARFAESDGFEHDKIRTEAWRYRDWVIRALNADMPYDRFLALQVAGDELVPGDPDAALATGFLVAGPDMPDINLRAERRHTVLNEMTGAVGEVFLAATLGCAACHDHVSDPVSQADFYRFRAFFDGTLVPDRNKQLGHLLREGGAAPPASHLMIRGDFRRPGPALEPAFLRVLNPGREAPRLELPPATAKSSGRRAALAAWLARPGHPLTARVVVNRLWQHHFNRPLVATPNDFGLAGAKPTHPALLDWLATELPRRGWSLKEMHRLIVTSDAYRRSSRAADAPALFEKALAADPGNHLLARANRRRLSGEAVRDTLLFVSGRLNRKAGGPGVRPPLPAEVTVTLLKNQWELTPDPAEHTRRSIYLFVRRNLRFPIFDVFDRPDGNASCARRATSTTAPQALTLLNSEFSLDAARHLAGRVLREAPGNPAARAHLVLLGRAPALAERALAESFLEEQSALLAREARTEDELALPLPTPENIDAYRAAALTDLCLALINSNAFLYVD